MAGVADRDLQMKAIPEHSAAHAARLQESPGSASHALRPPRRPAELPQLLGNRGFARWLSALAPDDVRRSVPPLQAKLTVGPVDDPLEHEADRVADAVVQGDPAPMGGVTRAAPDATHSVQPALSEPGMAVPASIRRPLEQRLGHDFSGVRLHTGPASVEAAAALQARAFTLGQDIVFGAGEYAPQTQAGGHLLAHELAHVVQQSRIQSGIQSRMQPSGPAAGARIQRQPAGKGKPADKDEKPKAAKAAALKPDAEKTFGDYYLASYTIQGISLGHRP
jgi:hypothetical protein